MNKKCFYIISTHYWPNLYIINMNKQFSFRHIIIFSRFYVVNLFDQSCEFIVRDKELTFTLRPDFHLLQIWVNSLEYRGIFGVWCPFFGGVLFVDWLQKLPSSVHFFGFLLHCCDWLDFLSGFQLLLFYILKVSKNLNAWLGAFLRLKFVTLLFWESIKQWLILLSFDLGVSSLSQLLV